MYKYILSILIFLIFISKSKGQFIQAGSPYSCDKCQIGDIKFGDMDNDGHLDMVLVHFHLILSTDRNRLVWFKNDGFGRFLPRQTISTANGQGSGLLLTDIDKDGDLDIIVSYQSSVRVVYHENLGNGVFGPEKLIINNILAPKLMESFGDYDGNGFDDFMCAAQNINDKGIRLFMVDTGNITVNVIYPNSTTANGRFKSIDFDKDGDIDIIGQPTNSSTVNWFKNENGSFNSGLSLLSFSPNTFSFAFDIGDINNDGDLDIISSNTSDKYISYYENAGPGQVPVFPVKKNIQRIGNQKQVKLVDIDLDGDLDILTMDNTTQGMLAFENYGGNGFSAGRQIAYPGFGGTNPSAATMHIVDFDKDGDMDIFVLNSGNSNTGGGNVQYLENPAISSYISGSFYHDVNENGKKDEGESIIKDILPRLVPSAFEVNYNDENGFKLRVRKGKYTASFVNNPCWELTQNQPSSYQVNLDTTNAATLHFGLRSKSEHTDVLTKLTSGPTRCGFTVPFTLQVKNVGCTPVTGVVKVVLHPLAVPIIPPDSDLEIEGDTIYYSFENIFSERIISAPMQFKIAGVEHLGDTISMQIFTYLKDASGSEFIFSKSEFQSVINCAYDPNDKLVEPNRDVKNFTLQDETLFYTVRFQNTGTDTAFTVVIRDTLDAAIDINTLKVYNSSHACSSDFNLPSNSLIFRFDNILLPDSTTNQVGSNGFVSYYCKSKSVNHKTRIHNRASIYFDYNPPIHTNKISNIIVKQFSCQDSISPSGKYTYPVIPAIYVEDISCHHLQDGKITLNLDFGTPPYYLNNTDTFNQEIILENLKDSTYYLNIHDSGNCILNLNATVYRPDTLIIQSKIINATGDETNGSIKIESVSGGTPPYSFLWENGSTGTELLDLSPGEFGLTVTDSKGCKKFAHFIIEKITGLNDKTSVNPGDIKILINPVSDRLTFNLPPDSGYPTNIEIFNNQGVLVLQGLNRSLSERENTYSFDVNDIVNGIYILRVWFDFGYLTKKFEIFK